MLYELYNLSSYILVIFQQFFNNTNIVYKSLDFKMKNIHTNVKNKY